MPTRRTSALLSAAALAAALGLTGCAVAATTTQDGSTRTASEIATPDDLTAEAILAANSDATTVNDDEWDASTAVDLAVSADTVTITEAGVYRLSGDYTGGVVVDAGDEAQVVLILDGAEISNADGPGIQVTSADDVGIFLEDGSTNTVSDAGTGYADDADFHAAIASDADLTISGTGALEVDAVDDGISTSDDLVILSGTIAVTAGDDGLRGHDALVVKDGALTVDAGGDALTSDQDGDETQGWIELAGGTLDLTAGDDGLDAQTDIVVTGGALTVDAADDGLHSEVVLAIEGGEVTVANANEGIESFTISIAGGTIDVTTSDDGLNASGGTSSGGGMGDGGQLLSLSGGTLTVNAQGDGLDSNGSIEMTGGDVVVQGPTADDNGALDSNGSFTISGGTLVAIGSSGMAETPDADSAQGFVSIGVTGSAGDVVEVTDADGTVIAEVTASKSFGNIVVSTAEVVDGQSYTATVNGSSAGTGTAGEASSGFGGGGGMGGGGGGQRQGGGGSAPRG
ncbi:carbohydrate-binding domain-containing protein [Protaetiibacter intestinalis]|uniref:Carbohydrate-binding domain-containing protein n=1 Tax=Protaetiibacter intestinalis TaxID=2419774 RepID=A0A387B873_9MICO|nr:carbohydrate-binding domain-containing protein [Protaetiibacter intestinalis]AYF97296.1 carbohydrate-binding domain-containing protein [Protaetiibacter intestinalis]